jgi:DNA repair photolyase
VLIAPLMPGINDAPEQIEPLLQGAIQAGAKSIGGLALHLRSGVREIFMDWLGSQRPDLVERYEELYSRGAYAPVQERKRLAGLVRHGSTSGVRRDAVSRGPAGATPAVRPSNRPEEPASEQKTLF